MPHNSTEIVDTSQVPEIIISDTIDAKYEKIFKFIFIIMSLLVPIVFLGIASDPYDPVKTAIIKISILTSIVIWVYKILEKEKIEFIITPLYIPLLLLFITMCISLQTAYNLNYAFERFFKIIPYFLLFVIILNNIKNIQSLEHILYAVFFSSILVSIYGIAEYYGFDFYQWDLEWQGRVSSSLGNPAYLGGYLIAVMPTAFFMFLGVRVSSKKMFLFITLILTFTCLLLTYTRSAWSSALCSIVICGAIILRVKGTANILKNQKVILFLLLSLIILISVFSSGNFINKRTFSVIGRLFNIKKEDVSLNQRALIWRTTFDMIKDKPVTGVGLGNYKIFYPYYQRKYFLIPKLLPHISFPDSPHNDYMEIWVEMGFFAFLFFLVFIAMYYKIFLKYILLQKTKNLSLAISVLSGTFAVSLYSLFQFPLRISAITMLFWLFIAMGTVVYIASCSVSLDIKKINPYTKLFLKIYVCCACLYFSFLSVKPVASSIYFHRGEDLALDKKWEKAITETQKAIALSSPNDEMHYMLGTYFLKIQRYDKAIEELKYAAELNPNLSIIHNNLGNAFLYTNKLDNAIKEYNKAIDLEPTYPITFYNLGIAYYKKKIYNVSIISYKRTIALNPNIAEVYYNLSLSLAKIGKYEEAIKALAETVSLRPKWDEAWYIWGNILNKQNLKDAALEKYNQAVKVNPHNVNALGNIGIIWYEKGERIKAKSQFEKVKDIAPNNALNYYWLGNVYEKDGNIQKAKENLVRALQIEPENKMFKNKFKQLP